MRIAVFQPPYPMQDTPADAGECLRWMRERLDRLQPGEQDLVLLPEYANTPGLEDRQQLREFAGAQGKDFLRDVAASAARLQSLIVLAGLVGSGERWFNRTLVYDKTGALAFSYDKVHLTDVERYGSGLTPGSMPAVFQYEEIRLGFATCFDLSFPEHFAALAGQRADLVLCPSYQRSESAGRICSNAQVRALDSGTYLIRSSYAMPKPGVGGRSLVAAPDGTLLENAGEDACVIFVDIDPGKQFTKPASHGQKVVEYRQLIDSHRRPATYRPRVERAKRIYASPLPRLCANRGLSQACPENTLAAFAAAMAAGAHEVACDVRASRDGVLVACHDATVDRTTNGSGSVAGLGWEDICTLDAGSHAGDAWRGIRMPRLEEVLDTLDGRVGLNIRIRDEGANGATVRKVCDLLTEHALTDSAYISLETESALRAAVEYAPEVPRACLASQDNPAAAIDIAKRYACQRIQFSRDVDGEDIRRAHEAGLVCNLFWSDDPKDAMGFVDKGIDVILTNCANTMIADGFDAFR